jgi:hypothetical protein
MRDSHGGSKLTYAWNVGHRWSARWLRDGNGGSIVVVVGVAGWRGVEKEHRNDGLELYSPDGIKWIGEDEPVGVHLDT